MILAGIDEAGRGPVIGPMVMAIVVLPADRKIEYELKEAGVTDSKLLSLEKMLKLEKLVRKKASDYSILSLKSGEIDSLMDKMSLNEIEAVKAGQLIAGLKTTPEIIFIDSPDTNAPNFAKRIKKYCSPPCKISSEHKADLNHTVCAAASILAKTQREKSIAKLRDEYGDFGSGYPSDPKTKLFLKEYLEKHKKLPDIARKKWATSKNAYNDFSQTKLYKW